ncbi:uncharacterized protein LOC144919388 [Branchiostoma floridae x Branchiostoma belcheri]
MSTEGPELEESLGSLQIGEDDEESEDSSDEGSEDCSDEEAKLPDSPWRGLYYGDEIKRMISHTLKGWCNNEPKPKIYIVTPFIDEEGLEMVKRAIGSHQMALYTREEQKQYNRTIKLQTIMTGFVSRENLAQLRVGIHEIENQKHYYHCKFVAAEFPDRVEILMTSANLTSTHFMREQIDSVQKYDVTPEDFEEIYLQKLKKHSHDYEWPTTETVSGEDNREQQKKRAPNASTRQGGCFNCGEHGHCAKDCPKTDCYRGGEKVQLENQQNGAPPSPQQSRMPYRSYQNRMPSRAPLNWRPSRGPVFNRHTVGRWPPPNHSDQRWDRLNRRNQERYPHAYPNQQCRRDPKTFDSPFPPPFAELGDPYMNCCPQEMNGRLPWPQRETSGGHDQARGPHYYHPEY